MEPIHQDPIHDKDPREGVGLDTLVIRLDTSRRAPALWSGCGCGRLIADQCPGWSHYRDKAHAWIIRHKATGVRLAAPRGRRDLHLSLEVSRLASAAAEPWRGRWRNTAKASPQEALDIILTILGDLSRAVGDPAPWTKDELEIIRLDVFADFLCDDLSPFRAPPVVRRRRIRGPRVFCEHKTIDLETCGEAADELELDASPHSIIHYRCGSSGDPRREATRIYDRGALHARAADLQGVARYEAEHGRAVLGSAKRPLALAFKEDKEGCEQIAGVGAWSPDTLDLLDACDPSLWVAILGERLTEQALVPDISGGFADVHDLFNALRAENVSVNDAALYSLMASAGDKPLDLPSQNRRRVKRRVESKTKLRFGVSKEEKEAPSQRIWTILAATRLDPPSLGAFKRVETLSRLLQLDPDLDLAPTPALELELRSAVEVRDGEEEEEVREEEALSFGFHEDEDRFFRVFDLVG